MAQVLPSLETAIPGLYNSGLLALNELQHGTPKRSDWDHARSKARGLIGKTHKNLLRALEYRIDRLDNLTSVLRRKDDHRVAIAVLLDQSECPETGTPRFNDLSPVTYALAKADSENTRWMILLQGSRLRLYSKSISVGVGRRGRTETYVECQLNLLSDNNLAYPWLLFSADALKLGGSLDEIMGSSERFAGNLAKKLRERIYDFVMPTLAKGIARARNLSDPQHDDLAQTYQMALTVLFRLLFLAYAEDRDLLPYKNSDAYRKRSLKAKAVELAERVAKDKPIDKGSHHWHETKLLWDAINSGNTDWSVPAYNGGLFSNQASVSPIGFALADVELPNSVFERVLRELLVTKIEDGAIGPVDFRSLSVREFGTIYEGLLESELAVAKTDLELDKEGNYRPKIKQLIANVQSGDIYLHNRSGQRKASGSYYTKSFAVEHLLDRTLEPALDDHFSRLGELDETNAAERFFDFRVADIAMGSGHFLIAAIDHIEKRMSESLSKRPLPGVRNNLSVLRRSSENELGKLAEATIIEDSQLLRRTIARRCIFGVDLNPLSVQLARLSVWIHTFVPGLPLSILDHNLINGNSLVGIGTFDELQARLQSMGNEAPLLTGEAYRLLGEAKAPLERLRLLNDATIPDIARAHKAYAELSESVADARDLCDLVAAAPLNDEINLTPLLDNGWRSFRVSRNFTKAKRIARDELSTLHPVHFPVAFPEVFLRDKPGFDVILGNPPWQEVTIEVDAFWARHFPGLRGLSQREQEAEKLRLEDQHPDLQEMLEAEQEEMAATRNILLTSNAYPGMGKGDADLYKAFVWRFWHLVVKSIGRIGVVLPRSALTANGSTEFRKRVMRNSRTFDITMLENSRGWAFTDVHPSYTFTLLCIMLGNPGDKSVQVRGPYQSIEGYKQGMVDDKPAKLSHSEISEWTNSASLPLLPMPSTQSLSAFLQLRKAPRLEHNHPSKWRARPDREMDATNQKYLMDLNSASCPAGFWPVYKGESFNLWNPETGLVYAYADPKTVRQFLQTKRTNASQRRSLHSAHSEFSREHNHNLSTLPCYKHRIAFRGVTGRKNHRTIIACLLPPNIFLTNSAPYLLWPRGDERDQAYLLGILASIPLDWYARRYIETQVNFFLFNPFPIPRPSRENLAWCRVVELAGRLASPDERFAEWAVAVGVEHGPIDFDQKQDMVCELDAVVAHLYGLSEEQLVHIFETFHIGWDYEARLTKVRQHFQVWSQQ